MRAEHRTAYELGEQLLRQAKGVQNPAFLLQAHVAVGNSLSWLEEFAPAREHLEQGLALYEPQRRHSLAFLYGGADPGVHDLSYPALDLWLLGYPDQALKRSHESLSLAQELSHLFSLTWALSFATWLRQVRRERQATQEQAESAITLSTEHRFPFWLGWASILQGWAMAEKGQREEGIAQIHQGLAVYKATETELTRPYFLALLTEAHGAAGQTEEGLAVLAEALAVVNKTGERFYEAELYRLKGELLLAQARKLSG